MIYAIIIKSKIIIIIIFSFRFINKIVKFNKIKNLIDNK